MNIKLLTLLLVTVGSAYGGLLFGKGSIIGTVGDALGINNLVSVNADAEANLLGNKVGIDGAVGIGKEGIGAHVSGDADILGQKLNIHGDLLDGHAIDQHQHEVYRDSRGRQYTLQREYVGSKSVLARKYLDNGQIYVEGKDDDDEIQHRQEQPNSGNYWDDRTNQIVFYDPSKITSSSNNVNVIYDPSSNGNIVIRDPGSLSNTNVIYVRDSNGNIVAVPNGNTGNIIIRDNGQDQQDYQQWLWRQQQQQLLNQLQQQQQQQQQWTIQRVSK
ncbi:unnamed protein product [Diabrotica balteata]|uniref:Curlin associated repeat-containing protein n=1 Tax=Diabrotica balteata TaxID=107213 RepID=A0A9N9T078_DIABA|nr:unnamed protein product [Diabrotica balteata]